MCAIYDVFRDIVRCNFVVEPTFSTVTRRYMLFCHPVSGANSRPAPSVLAVVDSVGRVCEDVFYRFSASDHQYLLRVFTTNELRANQSWSYMPRWLAALLQWVSRVTASPLTVMILISYALLTFNQQPLILN